jgi:hypothetical protein
MLQVVLVMQEHCQTLSVIDERPVKSVTSFTHHKGRSGKKTKFSFIIYSSQRQKQKKNKVQKINRKTNIILNVCVSFKKLNMTEQKIGG